jgi:hypothetical protein
MTILNDRGEPIPPREPWYRWFTAQSRAVWTAVTVTIGALAGVLANIEQISSFFAPDIPQTSIEASERSDSREPFIGYNNSDVYDVIFVLDKTASNIIFLGPVKKAMNKLAENTANESLTLNFGMVCFADRTDTTGYDNPPVDRVVALSNAQDAAKHLAFTEVSGGGDRREAVFDGVYEAIVNTKWTAKSNRAIVLIGDAPSHTDNTLMNPAGHTVESLLQRAAEKSVRINTICVVHDSETTDQFSELSRGVNAVLQGKAHVGYDRIQEVIVETIESWIADTRAQPRT